MIDNICSEFQRSHEVGGQEGIVHNHKDILGGISIQSLTTKLIPF